MEILDTLKEKLGQEVEAHNVASAALLQHHHRQDDSGLALPHVQLQT